MGMGSRGNWGWVLLGWTGLVLLCTAQNPARLVYGSAALVASLRGQQSHFATLPINISIPAVAAPAAAARRDFQLGLGLPGAQLK